ncbi:MAG TPA: molybdopterin-dependent oxidoreductase [Gordonibacter urolithinfaciens]|uniref:molybdopterin-containing oxidoreductase family protein n=1 Tax=Gordonibacter urolithinfaciens TaxID=1335613 RepID=UPI001D4F904D|nr:molybdopterin-dependent oxidoreductase [Gordonibacter urolithinfaciens]HJF62669.1 molybdopterin-dependent oxidoreductase [Gordonibacter urolithinfaciens]
MTEWKRQEGEETIFRTCAWSPPGCHPVGCGLQVHVKDGKVVKVEGDPEHPITKGSLCTRCLALPEYIYHPDRITHPLKRAREDRGKDKWEQCTWDEATDLIADNAKRITEQYGAEAICVFGGTGREGNNWYPQWANLVFGTPNSVYAQAGWSCYGPRMTNTAFMIGGGYPEIDYAQKFEDRYEHEGWVAPECILIWGKEPLRSNPDGLYGHAVIEMVRQFGTKLICVDPRVTWLGTRSEEVLQLRPGTDTALAMAFIYVMAHDDLVDHDFIDKWCYGYEQLVERVQDMPPAKAAEICGVPEEQIWRAARLYGNAKPSSVAWGLAVDENPNGTQLGQCLIALMAITGFIDAPGGTTLGMGDDQGNVVRDGGSISADEKVDDATDSTLELAFKNGIMTEETWGRRIGIDKYPAMGSILWTVMPDEFLKALETEKPYKIHMAHFISSNPIGTAISAEPQRWYEALKKLDFCCAADLFMNPTTMACCDVFLPIATTVEHDGMVVTHYGLNSSFYGAQNKCVQVGECKSDVEAMMAVGKKMYPDFWNRFETQTDYDNFHVMRSWLPYEELREKVTVMSNEPYFKYEVGKLRPDGQVGFPTSTGRVELYSYMYEQFGENPLPYYEDPAYGPERTPELMEKYPFILTTGARKQEFFHSEHKQVPSLRQITPYPQIDLNPADAARLGIEEDDWVEIASPYGAVRQRAHVVPTIKEGVCHAMHGWWYPEEDGEEPNLFGNWKSNINVLMPNSVNGVMGFGNTFKQMICSLKKVEGEGGPNDPDSTGIFLEPSRQAEFTYQQVWRPTDETLQG